MFCLFKFMVQCQKQAVYNQRDQCSIDHFRYNDPSQIEEQADPSAKEKLKKINHQIIDQIAECDQKYRHLDIIIIKNAITETVEVSDIGEEEHMKPTNIPSRFPRISAKETVRMIGRFGETDAMANVCINVVCRTNVSKIKIIIMTLRFTVLLLPAYCFLSVFRFLFPESSLSHSVPETGYLSVPHRYFSAV